MGLSAGQTVVRSSNLRKRSLMLVVHYSVRRKCGVQVWLLIQDQSDNVGGRVDLGRLVELAKDGEVARSLDPWNSRLVHCTARGMYVVQARLLLQDQSGDAGGHVDLGRLVRLAGDCSMIERLEKFKC